jgi:prophage antirepressor-like protein|tara:strand:+ start:120 stop:272 length:153 start_codon:yes stop_codon:yes gene_type:complete
MNPLNELILRAKIKKFKETKNALEFADWVNENVTPEYLDTPSYKKVNDEK